jgi:hypothetical protein
MSRSFAKCSTEPIQVDLRRIYRLADEMMDSDAALSDGCEPERVGRRIVLPRRRLGTRGAHRGGSI